ncbi:MAG: hypothetical protein LUI07_09685 [Lachnospiraceae bacterium]|nr:hypothetical protein [Lachnospiraceae bacterium]
MKTLFINASPKTRFSASSYFQKLQVFRNFCARSGLNWCGGIGISGGVMLNVTQILFTVNVAVLLLNVLPSGILYGNFLPTEPFMSFAVNTFVLLFLNLGVLYNVFQMGRAINRGSREHFGNKYTRIMLPSLLFILIADIFFTVISVFSGGIFRGWLSPKNKQDTDFLSLLK